MLSSLGDSLRGRDCFRRVRLDDPVGTQVRELSRVDEDLRRESNQLAKRLREQLHRFHVQALKLCPAADESWLWSLLELASSPQAARGLRTKRAELALARALHVDNASFFFPESCPPTVRNAQKDMGSFK